MAATDCFLVKGKRMQTRTFLAALATATMLAGIPLMTHPGFAQSAPTTKQSQSAPMTKQPTDGEAPTPIGPGSGAYKQKTEAPTPVGPGSQASKQATDGESPTPIGPGSGAYKQKTDAKPRPRSVRAAARSSSNVNGGPACAWTAVFPRKSLRRHEAGHAAPGFGFTISLRYHYERQRSRSAVRSGTGIDRRCRRARSPSVVRIIVVHPPKETAATGTQVAEADAGKGKSAPTGMAELTPNVHVGSGFSIAPGLVATNRHVVEGAVLMYVSTADGARYPAKSSACHTTPTLR